jgi:hypothetical protein
MSAPQSFKNHAKWDPPFHFFLMPFLLVNLIFSVYTLVYHWPFHRHLFAWWVVMSVMLFLGFARTRMYSPKTQDRTIRLEERLRMAALLDPTELVRSHALTASQLIGLRFASDSELPNLVQRALDEDLTQKQIKEAIVEWRPDYMRV